MGCAYITRNLKSLPRLPTSAVISFAKPSTSSSDNLIQLPRLGVSNMEWSGDGQYLAAREESHPRCVWIWSALDAKLVALLVQLDSVSCMKWMPPTANHPFPVLAFCCNSPRVYFWNPSTGPSWADLPYSSNGNSMNATPLQSSKSVASASTLPGSASISYATKRAPKSKAISILTNQKVAMEGIVVNVTALQWIADGTKMILIGKERFCTCDVVFQPQTALDKELELLRGDVSSVS